MAYDSNSSNDDLAYLDPDFDLTSLTVPRIRSILVNHDISYPASAKKSQLIDIMTAELIPKAKKLLRERERVRRTSKGITNMPSSQETDPLDHETDAKPPPATPATVRRGRSRPSTRASTAETDENILPQRTTSRRRTTAKHPRMSDTDANEVDVPPRRQSRKTRKSEAFPTPRASTAGSDDYSASAGGEARDGSVFTDDNPFQSGSSPVDRATPRARTVSAEQRRRSHPRHSGESTAAGDRRKRKTEPPMRVKQEEDVEVPSRPTFDYSLGAPKAEEFDEEIEAGEEFTPEEQLQLSQEQARIGRRGAVAGRRSQGQGKVAKVSSWLVILTLLTGFAGWWRKEKIEIGYCGVGKPHWSLAETNVPDWADVIEPQCEPCPQHAFCYPEFDARCEQDFVLVSHPLSLGGLIPLPPTCEPDGEKVRRVKSVADRAIAALREQRARWECGEPSKAGKEVQSPDMTASELREEVTKLKRKGMSEEEFEELWRGAIGEITGREEVVTTTTGPSSTLLFTSTSLARLSLFCSFRRHLRHTLFAYRFPILLLVLVTGGTIYIRSRIRARRSDAARVPSLVGMTLDRLATQAALHASGEAKEAWISVAQLRDDVLRDELKGNRREELWRRVQTIVERNANVRASVREGRGGDVSRVWEWVGGLVRVGGKWDSTGKRRESKVRFSLSPSETGSVEEDAPAEKPEVRKWNEGRPLY